MPIYDFECKSCETINERLVSISESEMQLCEVCNKPIVRLLSPTVFMLDGTDPGFPTAYANWNRKRTGIKS
jgi:putative FmdB family regulatory protein